MTTKSTRLSKMTQKPGFVVIGAGLPRTGTFSTREALTELLQGPCYHMETVILGDKKEREHWHRALDHLLDSEAALTEDDWKNFLEGRGFKAGVDFPFALFYK